MCSVEFINVTVTCSPFGSILHGSVNYDTDPEDDWYPLNTRATFTCDSGFTQCGDPSATCQTSGRWSELTPPTCRGNNFKIFFQKCNHILVFHKPETLVSIDISPFPK